MHECARVRIVQIKVLTCAHALWIRDARILLLLKTSGETIGNVIRHAKHATNAIPNAQPGDLLLIAQTISSLELGEKQIRYVMTFKGYRLDTQGESQRIWGKQWKYMIDGYDVTEVPGFDLKDIQVTNKNYGPVVTHCRLDPKDEKAILKYISKEEVIERARSITRPKDKGPKEILQELKDISSRSRDAVIIKSQRYFRDPRKSALLKELYDYKCQICGVTILDNEGKPYAETHHITPRAAGGEDDISNMLVLCPNDHKRFDLGSAKLDLKAKTMYVDRNQVPWTNKHL